ncbi:unnamed protein product [Phaedon cochleariae]|uniref:Putative inorganic phosphate cotransporter n=1 Tax=Phaedon cochleariae TaxID=80249 RepID=A0A9P0GPE1_PHACE|nr:unnamed protein product [Phaedon cochleariae]
MENESSAIPLNGPRFGVRHVQVFFIFMLITIAFGTRVQLSVAIVAMTNSTASSNPNVPTYDWDNKSVILSSFYWGYIVLQVFAAELAKRYGARKFLLVAMTVNSTINMLVPLMASLLGSYGVMGSRALQGLSQGFFYPSSHNILGKWAPSEERSVLSTVAFSGSSFGTIVTMVVVGILCSSWIGWESSFYIIGALGYTWVFFYAIFGASSPAEHKTISKEEKEYIESSLDSEDASKLQTPWKSIFTSPPFLAVYITQIGTVWGNSTLLAEIPTYMNKVMGFDITSNGLLSAAPYLTSFIFAYSFSFISDYIVNNNYLSVTWSRKLFTMIATLIPAMALLVLGFLPLGYTTLSVVMLIVAVGFQSAQTSGYLINHIDLSPNFAGTLMGIGNGTANICSILGPLSVQWIVTDETDKSQWRIIFIIAAMMYLLPSLFYLFFASGEVQPWDSSSDDDAVKRRLRRKKISVYSIMSIN